MTGESVTVGWRHNVAVQLLRFQTDTKVSVKVECLGWVGVCVLCLPSPLKRWRWKKGEEKEERGKGAWEEGNSPTFESCYSDDGIVTVSRLSLIIRNNHFVWWLCSKIKLTYVRKERCTKKRGFIGKLAYIFKKRFWDSFKKTSNDT